MSLAPPRRCDLTSSASTMLAADPRAPGRARRFAADLLCQAHHGHRSADLALVVSELVTNGLRHGLPPLTLTMVCRAEEGLWVSVTDHAFQSPSERTAVDGDESGRGLRIVSELGSSWGVEPVEEGKHVWCLL